MFYRPQDGHGLPHNPFTAIVAPRPIGWISTRGPLGDNLAPYSFFNAIAYEPPQVMFASTGLKDSVTAIRESGVFCVNMVSAALLDQMNQTSAPLRAGQDEFTFAGVEKTECSTIDCPRATAAPAALECQMTQIITLPGHNNFLILAQVTGVHIAEDCLVDGHFTAARYTPIARMGYTNYTAIHDEFALDRPKGG